MSATHVKKIPLRLTGWEKKNVDQCLLAHGRLYNAVLSSLLTKIYEYHQLLKEKQITKNEWKKKKEERSSSINWA